MSEFVDCTFEERDEKALLMCSASKLIFPRGAFNVLGIDNVLDVKYLLNSDYNKFQYLINCYYIVEIVGGSNWSVKYVCDMPTWEKYKANFGIKVLERAKNTGVPWHIARLVEDIENNCEAEFKLRRLKKICRTKKLDIGIKEALMSNDLGARCLAIEKFLGLDFILPIKYKYRDDAIKYLAWYILNKGEPILDINKNCHLRKAKIVSSLDINHIRLLRSLETNVPLEIARIVDDFNDDIAMPILYKIEKLALSEKVGSADMISNFVDIRCAEILKYFSNDLKEFLKRKFECSPEYSLSLGYYILNDGVA